MGAGIAQIALLGDYQTTLYDPVPEALEAGGSRLREALSKGVKRGRWGAAQAEAANGRLSLAAGLDELGDCELVIEAGPEDLSLKREIFTALAVACGDQTILATNTSSLAVGALAATTPHPQRVIGMHFFNPPALMKLVEIVATPDSSARVLREATAVGERMGRVPIQAKDSPGFIANRLARPFTLEPLRMLGEGLGDAASIDRVCRVGGGFRMGPFELIDLIGLDVNLEVARSFYAQGGKPARWRPSPVQEKLVTEGRLGRKSGSGFFRYDQGPHRDPDPDLGIEAPTLAAAELERIDPCGPKILPRLLAQISNEAAFALEEQVGAPPDMETAMRLGFNWPLGPLALAANLGPAQALRLLQEMQRSGGDAYLAAPLLRRAAAEDSRLEQLAP